MPKYFTTNRTSLLPKTKNKFPINISGNWIDSRDIKVNCPWLESWLLDAGSLTERLQTHCQTFRLEVIGYQKHPVAPKDALKINCNPNEIVIREVVLLGDGVPWVFAHTIIPQVLFENRCGNLAKLGDEPLSNVIFSDANFLRQPFELTTLEINNSLLSDLSISTSQILWGRRSVFKYKEHKMMIEEVFLPSSPAYAGLKNLN